ncbi:MAG: thiamine-monophosphate kinase [Pirellulales bacterium]|nr:thiamine-monophosphate kinase [Pirellulales bacterium]
MEFELIEHLRRRIPSHSRLLLGPGDDAAVLQMADIDQCVMTVDLLTDQVDFELEKVDPRRVGRKALAVNLSDLAAMAAEPVAAVISLALPRVGGLELAVKIYEGLLPLAEQYDLAVAGGDTNSWDGPLALSITLIGKALSGHNTEQPRPLRRDGAQPGDRIILTGSFGGSILGHHFDFTPRIREAIILNQKYNLHAGIDASDGLSIDLSHIVKESGCGAILDLDAVPVSKDAQRLAAQLDDGSTSLEHALSDGEDFELILAVSPKEAQRMLTDRPVGVLLTDVGLFVEEPGLWQTDSQHGKRKLIPRGWEHKFD